MKTDPKASLDLMAAAWSWAAAGRPYLARGGGRITPTCFCKLLSNLKIYDGVKRICDRTKKRNHWNPFQNVGISKICVHQHGPLGLARAMRSHSINWQLNALLPGSSSSFRSASESGMGTTEPPLLKAVFVPGLAGARRSSCVCGLVLAKRNAFGMRERSAATASAASGAVDVSAYPCLIYR